MKADSDAAFALLLNAALRQLAVRERSVKELQQKLQTIAPDAAQIDQVIQQLQQDGLQSDERFCESYIRSYQNKGHGPLKIRLALVNKGINEALIQQYLNEAGSDWIETLQALFAKKFTPADFATTAMKAKIYRFFQGKGFSFDQVRQLEKSFR